jgi:hypothetical protein
MSGMLRTMKYTINSRGQLLYRRRYPKRLQAHPQIKAEFYTRSLGVRDTATDDQKLSAWNSVHGDFEKFIEGLSLANVEALDAAQALRIAEATIRANGLQPGILSPNPLLSETQNELVGMERWGEVTNSGLLSPILGREQHDHPRFGQPLNAEETIAEAAYKLLTEPKASSKASVLLLSECWEPYKSFKGIDTETREGIRELNRWNNFLKIAGDTVLDQESVHNALDAFVEQRSNEVTGSSARRELRRDHGT